MRLLFVSSTELVEISVENYYKQDFKMLNYEYFGKS